MRLFRSRLKTSFCGIPEPAHLGVGGEHGGVEGRSSHEAAQATGRGYGPVRRQRVDETGRCRRRRRARSSRRRPTTATSGGRRGRGCQPAGGGARPRGRRRAAGGAGARRGRRGRPGAGGRGGPGAGRRTGGDGRRSWAGGVDGRRRGAGGAGRRRGAAGRCTGSHDARAGGAPVPTTASRAKVPRATSRISRPPSMSTSMARPVSARRRSSMRVVVDGHRPSVGPRRRRTGPGGR